MNIWQSLEWEDFQRRLGRKTFRIQGGKNRSLFSVLPLAFGFTYAICQAGPHGLKEHNTSRFLRELRSHAKFHKLVFTKLIPESPLPSLGSGVKPSASKHPKTTLWINLAKTEEEILKDMKPKGRYNIKVAQKHGVQIRESNRKEDANDFYALLSATAKRDRFHIQEKSYYEHLLESLQSCSLILATYHETTVAAGLFYFGMNASVYLYGASSYEHRHLMAPYLLQWHAIRKAKQMGSKIYDFLGISAEDGKKASWQGITDFKTKFGGEKVSYPNPVDIVHKPLCYTLYRVYKRLWGTT